ncbi:Tmc6 protein, partial [Operophtera brumata]
MFLAIMPYCIVYKISDNSDGAEAGEPSYLDSEEQCRSTGRCQLHAISAAALQRRNSEQNALLADLVDVDEPDSSSKQADVIVRGLEQHQLLMEDNPVSEELRRNIEGQFGSAVGSYFRMVRRLFLLDLALAALLVGFVVIPQALHDAAAPRDAPGANWLLDWITGKTSSALSHVFANKVFCGWDFGVTAPRAAALNAHTIYNEFKELLSEQNKKQASLSFCTKLGQRLTNIVVTGLVLGCIGGVLYGLWALLAREAWELQLSLLEFYEPRTALYVTLARTWLLDIGILALLFVFWSTMFYEPRTALYVTLARTWLLDIGILALLFAFWSTSHLKRVAVSVLRAPHGSVRDAGADLAAGHRHLGAAVRVLPRTALYVTLARTWLLDIGILALLFVFWSTCHLKRVECWETRFGQEAYRLVMRPSGNAPEFNIAYNSLTLIYNQSVLWFGMLFSPLLAVVVAIKFLLLFYVKRACLLRACQPAKKVM